jgi:mitochondrial fission protein ELM1
LKRKEGEAPIRIWALLGARAGDNDQVIALAEALGLPFEVKQLTFNALAGVGPRFVGRSLISLTTASRDELLAEPAPDLTISVGHRSVPPVRVLRHRSRGRTRSIHLGFPRVSPGEFDLVITTPQYPVPDHPNVLRIPFAFTGRANPRDLPIGERLSAMPSPRRLLVVGGPTKFWVIDDGALQDTLTAMIEETRNEGGSVLVTTSPRTPTAIGRGLRDALAESGVPFLLASPGEEPDYASLLAAADSITATADSVAMVSDAIWTGKPVRLVPVANSRSGRLVVRANDALRPGQRLYPRDLRFFWRSLAELGLGTKRGVPTGAAAMWRKTVLDRAREVIVGR